MWLYATSAGTEVGKMVQVFVILLDSPHQFMISRRYLSEQKNNNNIDESEMHDKKQGITKFR